MANKYGMALGVIIVALIEILFGVYVAPSIIAGWSALNLTVVSGSTTYDLSWAAFIGVLLFIIAIALLPLGVLYFVFKRSGMD